MAEGNYSLDVQHAAPPTAKEPVHKLPIDHLVPGSDAHAKVLEYLIQRLNYSETQMTKFYSRWNASEKKIQAYISLPNYEQMLKAMNQTGSPPAVVSITVPYSYATIWTIVTYLIHTFCGQKPIFAISSYKAENVQNALLMETMLQFNADHTRQILQIIQWFLDAEIYGVGAKRILWEEEFRKKTIWTSQPPGGMLTPTMQSKLMRSTSMSKVYEGNKVSNIDPFLFFPDPRVPMAEVARKGEFVFWRSFEGKHALKRAEENGTLKWVDHIKEDRSGMRRAPDSSGTSQRSLVASGNSIAGDRTTRDWRVSPFYQVDQGTVEIIPKDLGLGDSDSPEKWIFAIGNSTQIIQAEPFEYNHGRHPVAVIEPSSFGYAFGQPGTMDFLGPIQDTLSWFINSRIHNVRLAMNNMFVVDPAMVEMQDLKEPGPGKIIRLKRSAIGTDVKTVLQQLQVTDVTAGHMDFMQAFLRMGDVLSAVNDNLKGIQDTGGRKTATEVRTAGEAGASRLAARARYISAQGMVDVADQMVQNIQQFQEMEFFLKVLGAKAGVEPIAIGPSQLAGDFSYPVSDGTLPIDKSAMMTVWKEIWMAIAQDQNLSQVYNSVAIFEYLAELGGAKNISQFKLQVSAAPDEQLASAQASGNAIPLPGLVPGGTGGPAGAGPRGLTNGGGPSGAAAAAAAGRSGAGAPRPIA